jgi:ATP-binding cassette subfamily B protein
MRNQLRALGLLLRSAVRTDPLRTLVALAVVPLVGLATPMLGLFLKIALDAVTRRDMGTAAWAAFAAVASLIGAQQTAFLLSRVRLTLWDRVEFALHQQIAELSATIPTIEHHERPEYLDKMALLRLESWWLGRSMNILPAMLSEVLSGLGIFVLLARVHPLLLLLPCFAIPSLFVGAAGEALLMRAEEKIAQPLRQAGHLFDLATGAGPAKEIRIFGIGHEILRRERAIWRRIDRTYSFAGIKWAIWEAGARLTFGIGLTSALGFVAWRAAHGLATPGDMLLALTAAVEVQNELAVAGSIAARLRHALRAASRLVWLNEYGRGVAAATTVSAPVPPAIRHGIWMRGVTFRYPGTDRAVLDSVDLDLPAGATVAIVGENGAGKTSLVKLLFRLYEPSSGEIRVDGVRLDAMPPDEWRARCSAGFQDFAQFELLARETVGVGDVGRVGDRDAVSGALARAGASDVLDSLADGLESQLGSRFQGAELSTGQWQKLALGRAMMRDAPLLLVLDEPTSALDAPTEHALFERYTDAARRAAESNGGITLLVSHRFSTVRMADLIVVMDGGRIVEQGSHAELAAQGGLYAELYAIQARAYR